MRFTVFTKRRFRNEAILTSVVVSHLTYVTQHVFCPRAVPTRGQQAQVHGPVRLTTGPSEAGLQTSEGQEPRRALPPGIWLQHERAESRGSGGVL